MKKNHKLLLGVLAITVLGTLVYLLYKQNQMRIWTELQPNIQIASDELIEILLSTEYKFENKVEHGAGELQKAKYGTPEDVWTIELVADQSRFTLTVLEYTDWEEANLTITFWTQWYKDTYQPYKGRFFSHGRYAIFIKPANIDIQKNLERVLIEACK